MATKPIYEGVNTMLEAKPGCAGLLRAVLVCAFLCGIGCGDDDASIDAAGPDEDSGHEEGPPRPDGGRPDGSEPDPKDAGRDATEPMPTPDASEPDPDSGEPDAGDPDSGAPLELGGLMVSETAEEMEDELDLFGAPGHRIWVEISDEQVEALNAEREPGGIGFGGFGFGGFGFGGPGGGGQCGDIYCPGDVGTGSDEDAKFADHVLVENVETQEVADYGKVEVDLVGQSTAKSLTESTIPNFRFDVNELDKEKRIGTFEHFRLNNGMLGSIFRENLAHRIYRALGYPALRSSFALLGNTVWGDNVWTPMVLMEMYKKRFCNDHQELVGGTCENMWEFSGDIGEGYYGGDGDNPGPRPIPDGPQPLPAGDGDGDGDGDAVDGGTSTDSVPNDWCQVSECDDSRLTELMTLLDQTERGTGFKAALADYIDWDRFHQFQCLSWIMWTGDDAIHTGNNTLLMQRDDGKFIWGPYSVDISAGQDRYTDVSLLGRTAIATGCQRDAECWADTISTCEDLIVAFDELNPEELVDETVTLLTDLEMMRYEDDKRAEDLREWFVERQEDLAEELELYRYLPDQYGNCPNDLVRCADGTCGTSEQCEDRCYEDQVWCEAYGECVYSYDCPPECPDEVPHYCALAAECVTDEPSCRAICDDAPGYAWCDYYDSCQSEGDCPNDDDGGVPMSGGAGGIGPGGAGGIGAGGSGGAAPRPD
jgi:hypothetical protein